MPVHQGAVGGDRGSEELVDQYGDLLPAELSRTTVQAIVGDRQDHCCPHGRSAARPDVATPAATVLQSGQAASAA